MLIFLNEKPVEITESASVDEVVNLFKPQADVFILNGFPTRGENILRENDRLVLIQRGEIPGIGELEVLMSSRHSPGVFSRLKKASVGIAGCGGLGSNVAVSLARVGIGSLVIVDFDVIEPSNLNRQQYFIDQIGMLKVDALKANIAKINPAVQVFPHPIKLTCLNIPEVFQSVDIIVEAFDRSDQKALLVETVERQGMEQPLILGSGMAGYGFNGLLHTRSMGMIHVCGDELAEAGPGFGLMAPRVAIVANMQANLVLEILLGKDPKIASCLKESGE